MHTVTYLLRLLLILLTSLLPPEVQAQYSQHPTDTTGRRKDDTLTTVTVTGRRQAIDRRSDRVVLQVESMMAATGGTAWDILERAPGVQATNEQLSLKGRSAVNVYIDGRPTYLQGNDVVNYLKAMPAGLIATIEVMSNPPAQYEAAGNGGIILITLKKGRTAGFNGNLLSENIQGRYARIIQSANINLLQQKVNFFANINNYNGSGVSYSKQVRQYNESPGQASSRFVQQGSARPDNDRFYARAGIDYQASSRTSYQFSGSYTSLWSTEKRESGGLQSFHDATIADTFITTRNTSTRSTRDYNLMVTLQHRFDTSGRQLTASADYTRYSEGYTTQLGTMGTVDGLPAYTGQRDLQQPYTVDIFSARTDYEQPVGKKQRWRAGAKTARIEAINTINSSITGNGSLHITSSLQYAEWVQALYASYEATGKRWNWQVGLRAEYTATQGRERNSLSPFKDTGFHRKYINSFPTLFVQYKLNAAGTQQLSFSYGRRIDRPRYTQLRPLATPVDAFNFTAGNPYLRPQFTDNIEIAWSLNNQLTITAYGSSLHDAIEEALFVKEGALYRQPANLGRKQTTGLTADGTITMTKWWTMAPVVDYTYSNFASRLNGQPIRLQGGSWHAAAVQQFNWQHGWSVEVAPDYSSRQVYFQYEQAATWHVHAGIGKKIAKEKGTIRLNIRDLFYTRRDDQYYNQVQGIAGFHQRRWDTRSITLAIGYRFSKGAKAAQTTQNNGEERKRLGD